MKKTIIFVLILVLGLSIEVAKADFTFGEPMNLGPIVNSSSNDGGPCLSADGLSIYFRSGRPGGYGGSDIWMTTRSTTNNHWEEPVNLGPTVNSSSGDNGPCISANALTLFFPSGRPGGTGGGDIWITTRETQHDDWISPVNLGPTVNSPYSEGGMDISNDGLQLFLPSDRPGGYGNRDLWLTTRSTTGDVWSPPVNLGPEINTTAYESSPDISADGLMLFFMSYRPGGSGDGDLWVVMRTTTADEWSKPVNLGTKINSAVSDSGPCVSADGRILYFHSARSGGFGDHDIYQAPILPIVDFNGDGIVDSADMCIMVDHWGEDYSLCDIGPMPWGDGIVDVQDLIVLAEHLFEVYPSAETTEVNEDNDGGQIELELGRILVVTLESNPSTGYRWEPTENNESILKQLGQAEFKSSETGDPPMVGVGGWEIFRFKAVSAGQMTLKLIYHRSWEDIEPLKTFSIQVTVN